MEAVTLPAELEEFAASSVASGRYRDLAELVADAIALLRDEEAKLADFLRSREEAQAEAEREGCLTIEEIDDEMSDIIDAIRRD
jgi:putative addiction module CopG family antidote